MDCSNCGAPIAPNSNICKFCGTVNDTDLRGLPHVGAVGSEGDRPCPRCGIAMNTIDVAAEGGFEIDRCTQCLGIFFDPAELESIVDASVSHVYRIDRDRMASLVEEEGGVEREVTYVKCPVCSELMNRKNYGARSGVVADSCKAHGVWLDGGELRRILKWAKAGGQLHDENRKKEEEDTQRRKRRSRAMDVEQLCGEPDIPNRSTLMLPGSFLSVLLSIFD